MTASTVKIPANGATRLSKQTWVEAEILKRYQNAPTVRKVIESAISEAVTNLLGSGDPEFIKIMQQVRTEGVEND